MGTATKLMKEFEASSSVNVNTLYLSHVHGDRAHDNKLMDNDEAIL
jgi:hypothetical protein